MELVVISIAALAAFVAAKRMLLNDLTAEKARRIVREGAIIIDVRSEEEYRAAHLKSSVNIPLSDIGNKIKMSVSDKDRMILLHCRTGSRSFAGKRLLKRMQYSNVYNLGSFTRAKRILNSGKNDRNIQAADR